MNQQQRLAAAGTYCAMLLLVHLALFGRLIPSLGAEGAWFYAGAALVLISRSLSEPFYTSPAQAMTNGFAALIVSAAFPPQVGVQGASPEAIQDGKFILMGYSILVIAISTLTILTKDSAKFMEWSDRGARMSGYLGSANAVYSGLFFAAAYAAYSQAPSPLFILVLSWIVVVVVKPVELAFKLVGAFRTKDQAVGRVVGVRNPGLIEIAVLSGTIAPGDLLKFHGSEGSCLVLDVSPSKSGLWALAAAEPMPPIGSAVTHVPDEKATTMLGPTEPGTSLNEVLVRIPAKTLSVREGQLVEVDVRGSSVLYQLVRAVAKSEGIVPDVTHRFIEIAARKIGTWNAGKRKFERVPWLPSPGASVGLAATSKGGFQADSIGVVPGTDFGIRVETDPLVTHNTAILGILGIGKTCLSFELIRRIVADGIKVVVLDITGEYGPEFEDICPPELEALSYERITSRIEPKKHAVEKSPHLGGNLPEFHKAIHDDLEDFLNSGLPIRIHNPSRFDVVKQDSKPYDNTASMAPLTLVETTRVITEELMALLATDMTSKARVCVVLEEAHSLVPEWNSTSYEGDKTASNAVAKSVLQGRKYGLGFLLITQRTANVAKTVLNQCNTVFAMRTFDATGMDFLRNYIGSEYSDVLSGLEDRSAVVFGRASSSPSPVIVELNDKDELRKEFWSKVSQPFVDGANDYLTQMKQPKQPPAPLQDISDEGGF